MAGPFNPFGFKEAPPVQTLPDMILMGVGAVLCLFILVPSAVLLPFSFKFNAIRQKQPFLMFFSTVCCILWFIGSAAANGFFEQRNDTQCVVFSLWFYYYGVSGWSNTLITRLVCLFLTTQMGVKRNRVSPLLIWCFLMLPCTILLICGSIWHESFVHFIPTRMDCQVQWPMTLGISGLILISIAVLFTLTLCTCRTRKEFNESWVEIIGIFLIFVVSVFLIACWCIRLNWFLPIRMLNLFQSIILGMYYVIAVQGFVLFMLVTCQFKWFKEWDIRFKQNTLLLLEEKKIKSQMDKERASMPSSRRRSSLSNLLGNLKRQFRDGISLPKSKKSEPFFKSEMQSPFIDSEDEYEYSDYQHLASHSTESQSMGRDQSLRVTDGSSYDTRYLMDESPSLGTNESGGISFVEAEQTAFGSDEVNNKD